MYAKKQIKFVTYILAGLLLISGWAQAEVTFGVQAPRGNAKALKKWGELGKYLEAQIGEPVKLVPLEPAKSVSAVMAGEAQFMLSNPVLAVVLNKKNGAVPLATMNRKSGPQFAGVIIAKKGSGIAKSEDLKGKKVMAFKFKKSAAAYVFQVKHLKDKGIDPHKDFKVFKEAKNQDDIVLAVQKGVMDAGFIKVGLMESMAKEGKIKMDEFTIVDQRSDKLAKVHTTILYPEWTVVATPSVDPATVAKVKTALLKLTASDKASIDGKIVGFVDAVSLDDLVCEYE